MLTLFSRPFRVLSFWKQNHLVGVRKLGKCEHTVSSCKTLSRFLIKATRDERKIRFLSDTRLLCSGLVHQMLLFGWEIQGLITDHLTMQEGLNHSLLLHLMYFTKQGPLGKKVGPHTLKTYACFKYIFQSIQTRR